MACLGPAPAAERILELKVCDPAMGSGAFLVEACRFLAEQVRAAWERSGALPALIEKHGEPLLHAKRLVAERCLYGVDKNPAAVELAKLSLWLETMSADKSFTFLDHVLRHGDSLVGLDLTQIRAFHWQPEAQLPTVARLVDQTLAEVREHREAIQALADDDSDATQREQRRLLELAELAMDRVKLVADACVGAFFAADKPKDREKLRKERLDVVEAWLGGDEGRRADVEDWSREMREKHSPFHWHLELPEVFFLERPDPLDDDKVNGAAFMDAFFGNPPFLAKNGISQNEGTGYIDWLQATHEGAHGNADLTAHFLRRASSRLGAHGAIGIVATNTISQGDTRATGLSYLLQNGFAIYGAVRSLPWPGDAAVSVSLVHLAKGNPEATAVPLLDGDAVPFINSQLRPTRERVDPQKLARAKGVFFMGCKIYGQGFYVSDAERLALVELDRNNAARLFPVLNGEQLNASPSQLHDGYVINFGQMTIEEAARWPGLLEIVKERVKPERDTARGDTADGAHRKKYWWQFAQPRPDLFTAISKGERCIVTAVVSKHLTFSFQPTDRVFSHALYVFALPAFTSFAVLQSRVHEPWARLLSSSMKNDLRYAASDCFETFPFPQPDPRAVIPAVEAAGERLYTARAGYMVDTNQGLTQTYNHLKDRQHDDPRILELRALHEAMDRAVLDAYGWTDLPVPPFCPLTPDAPRALDGFQNTIVDRLFVLNAERAAEERRLGFGKPIPKRPKPKPAASKTKPARGTKADPQTVLFTPEDPENGQ